jgi:hypothetical protein
MAQRPLTKPEIAKLAAIGLTGIKFEEQARKKLIGILAENEVTEVDDEELNDLIEMAEAFVEPSTEEAEAEEVEEEVESDIETDEELGELAEEVEEIDEKATKKAPAKPVAKATTTTAKKAPTPPTRTANGEVFNARENKAHLKMLEAFRGALPKEDFNFDILKQGFTVRMLSKNTKPTIFNYDGLRIIDGELVGDFYCNRFKKPDELIEVLPEAYQDRTIGMFRGESHPSIKKLTQTEVLDIIENSEVLAISLKKAGDIDQRMTNNREKLEESLNKGSKTPVVPAKKTVAPPPPDAKVVPTAAVKKPGATTVPAVKKPATAAPVVKKPVGKK